MPAMRGSGIATPMPPASIPRRTVRRGRTKRDMSLSFSRLLGGDFDEAVGVAGNDIDQQLVGMMTVCVELLAQAGDDGGIDVDWRPCLCMLVHLGDEAACCVRVISQ